MKGYIKNLFLVLVLVVFFFTLTACGKVMKNDSKIIGTWEYEEKDVYNAIYSFNEDGTGYFSFTIVNEDNTKANDTNKYTYEVKGNRVLITYEGDTNVFETEYSVKDNVLTIADIFGDEISLKRK